MPTGASSLRQSIAPLDTAAATLPKPDSCTRTNAAELSDYGWQMPQGSYPWAITSSRVASISWRFSAFICEIERHAFDIGKTSSPKRDTR